MVKALLLGLDFIIRFCCIYTIITMWDYVTKGVFDNMIDTMSVRGEYKPSYIWIRFVMIVIGSVVIIISSVCAINTIMNGCREIVFDLISGL